jgi:hypothetical protein
MLVFQSRRDDVRIEALPAVSRIREFKVQQPLFRRETMKKSFRAWVRALDETGRRKRFGRLRTAWL